MFIFVSTKQRRPFLLANALRKKKNQNKNNQISDNQIRHLISISILNLVLVALLRSGRDQIPHGQVVLT